MILGSHNTLTYLKPRNWWMRLFAFAYKCQSKTLGEQIKSGVHSIDIRVRFDEYGKIRFCHGWYESSMYFSWDAAINFIANQVKQNRIDRDPIYARIILETYGDNIAQDTNFAVFCSMFTNQLEHIYKDANIVLYGGYRKVDWKKLAPELPDNTTEEPISSVATDARWYEKICPWAYAKRMNKVNKEKYNDSKNIVIFDFI